MEQTQPQKQNKFTTGLLAQVWEISRQATPNGRQAELHLVQMEFRIERARRILRQIEQRANQAVEDLESTERRFNTLKDSFYSLQKEWKNWKKETEND